MRTATMPLHPLRSMLTAACCAGLAVMIAMPAHSQGVRGDRSWLAELDNADRAPLQRLIGHGPPAFADGLVLHNVENGLSWQKLHDQVVVIQSWTHANDEGREAMAAIHEAVSEFSDIDVQLLLLHTPEAADEAAAFVKRENIESAVVVDSVGRFCDLLGVYRQPVNLIIDRHGAVRYVGLTPKGVTSAVSLLIDEIYDPAKCPSQRSATGANKQFPSFGGSVGRARDYRGMEAPPLHVEEWITKAPDTNGKLTVLAFWATWCGPCIQSIPRLNQVAETFANDVAVIGVTNEQKDRIEPGLARRNLTPASFKYSIGYDPAGTMAGAVSVGGIPHAIVMCSDWVVRWQGHPAGLNDEVLKQLIEANNTAGEEPGGRWVSR